MFQLEKIKARGAPVLVQWKRIQLGRNQEVEGSIPGLAQWVKDPALPGAWCKSQTWLGSPIAVAVA